MSPCETLSSKSSPISFMYFHSFRGFIELISNEKFMPHLPQETDLFLLFNQTPKQVALVIFQESVISNINPPETMEENENNLIYMRSSFSLLQNAIRTTFNTIFTERFFFCFTFFGKRFSTSSSTLTYLTLLLCYNCFVKRSFNLIIC